jgi:hypothetical protein
MREGQHVQLLFDVGLVEEGLSDNLSLLCGVASGFGGRYGVAVGRKVLGENLLAGGKGIGRSHVQPKEMVKIKLS